MVRYPPLCEMDVRQRRQFYAMEYASSKAASSTLDVGWTELQAGRWQAARTLFTEAVTARATPEALEGLSWAAWWLDDPAAVFEAREHAYRLYKDAEDGAGAARMATWLACDERAAVRLPV